MKTPFKNITTERLLLRHFDDKDLNHVFKGLSHPKVIPFYGVSYTSLEATKEQMKWFADLEENGQGIWWAVCSRDNRTFYGAGGLNDWSPTHQKAEVGFWLLPQFWGQGIMKEAMPLILEYGFNELNLRRIEGFVESNNANCKRALEKIQFDYEGTMRDCEVKNGAFISIDIYAKINKL